MKQGTGIPASAAHTLRSTPQTVVWGHIAAGVTPALLIESGACVRIDTVSHQGLLKQDPAEYFGDMGVSLAQVLTDALDIYRNVKRQPGAGVHVLTGPIHVEGAAPGGRVPPVPLPPNMRPSAASRVGSITI